MWNNKNYKDNTYRTLYFFEDKVWNCWVHTRIPAGHIKIWAERQVTKWEAEQLLKWNNNKLLREIVNDIKIEISDVLYDNYSNYESE